MTTPPDLQCVDRAIRGTDGIGEVTRQTDHNESYYLLPYRGKVVSTIDVWAYGSNGQAAVQIVDDGEVRSYFNGMQKMGEPWPAAELDAFAPLMAKVNAAVEDNCSLPLREVGRISRD